MFQTNWKTIHFKILADAKKFYIKLYDKKMKQPNHISIKLSNVNVNSEDMPDITISKIQQAFKQIKNNKSP